MPLVDHRGDDLGGVERVTARFRVKASSQRAALVWGHRNHGPQHGFDFRQFAKLQNVSCNLMNDLNINGLSLLLVVL